MLTLAPCPHCAARVPDNGAFCDTCGRALAACPTCGELARPGEKCVTHGVATVVRSPAAGGAAAPVAAPVTTPTVAPPPRRGSSAPGSAAGRAASPPAAQPTTPLGVPAAETPSHVAQGTTVQPVARKLRLVALGGVSLPPLEVDADTIVGRGEGPFAILLDPFHDKGLSRRHCQFHRGATGIWSITDLAGRGSTLVSGDGTWTKAPLAQNASQPIEPGRDQVRLGSLTFRVEAIG